MSYSVLEVAYDGVFCDAIGEAHDGYFCISRKPIIVSPAPEEVGPLDRRRFERDMKDLSDLIDILANMVT